MIIGDLFIGIIYLFVILIIGNAIKSSRYKDPEESRYFTLALLIKIAGAFALGFIYTFYYGGGDTFSFFHGGQAWVSLFYKKPAEAIEFLFNPNNPYLIEQLRYLNPDPTTNYILRGTSELTIVRITGVLNLITFNSYYGTSVLYAFISFSGVWALYRTFIKIFPGLKKEMAIAILFIPSVVFWGSGILKDTVALACVGWLTYTAYRVFILRKFSLVNILLLIITIQLTSIVKGYILIAFMPGLVFWILNTYKSKIKSKFVRMTITPFLLLLTIAAGGFLVSELSASLGKYNIENLEKVASDTQWWHHQANLEGSIYSLGEIDYSPLGLLRKFPAAVNVTLFRPYLWEAGGAVVMLSALESLVLLFFTLYIFFKAGFKGIFRAISDPTIMFCLVFSLIFAFAVGFTSYNFGALARYKIPCIPFYVAMLFMIRYKVKIEKEQITE
jgi:hypothetical protein